MNKIVTLTREADRNSSVEREKTVFDLIDKKYIQEKNKLDITDELIEELAASKIPNIDFLYKYIDDGFGGTREIESDYSIIGKWVLVKRGYPAIKDVIAKIYRMSFDWDSEVYGDEPYLAWCSGNHELKEVLKQVPKEDIAYILRMWIKEIVLSRKSIERDVVNPFFRLKAEGITKKMFCDDETWEKAIDSLHDECKRILSRIEEIKIPSPYFQRNYSIYMDLIKYMESALA